MNKNELPAFPAPHSCYEHSVERRLRALEQSAAHAPVGANQEHGFARRESALQGQLAAVYRALAELPSPDQLRTDKRLTMDAKAALADLIELLTAPSSSISEAGPRIHASPEGQKSSE